MKIASDTDHHNLKQTSSATRKETHMKILCSFMEEAGNNLSTVEKISKELEERHDILISPSTIHRYLKELQYFKDGTVYTRQEKEDVRASKHKTFIKEHVRAIIKQPPHIALKTSIGNGRGTSVAIEYLFKGEIFGTIAGDSAVLIILSKDNIQDTYERLNDIRHNT